MATAGDPNELLDCSICHKHCTGPRKLSECGHVCCETCILIHVSKLKDEGDLEIGFPCPSCEIVNPGPKDYKAAVEWIKSLESGKVEAILDSVNEKKPGRVCSSCQELGRSSEAVKFCFECHELLCQMCSDGRHTFKILRGHKILNIDTDTEKTYEAGELFLMLCELTSCEDHPSNPIAFFCRDHEEYGCETCVGVKHEQCIDVEKANVCASPTEVVKEMAKEVKISAENICTYANNYIEVKKSYTEENNKQVSTIKETLKAIRAACDSLLDNLEETTIATAESNTRRYETDTLKETIVLQQLVRESGRVLALMDSVLSIGCISQQSVIVQKIREKIKSFEEIILSMREAVKLNKIDFKLEDMLLTFLNLGHNNAKKLVNVMEKTDECIIAPYQSKLLLKQQKVTKTKAITTKGKYDKTSPRYSSVNILRNGNIVLIDGNNGYCVGVKQEEGEAVVKLKLSAGYQGLTEGLRMNTLLRQASKTDNVIAVPRTDEKKILLLSVEEELAVKAEMKTIYQPKALHVLKNGDIAVAWCNPVAFGILSVRDTLVESKVYFSKDKSARQLRSFDFMTVDEKRSHVIQPCTSDKAVYCFDFEGNPKFKYSNGIYPVGVALDADFNIYVISNDGHSIHVISPAGVGLRIIQSGEGCPIYPLAIAFNHDGNEFAITAGNNSYVVTLCKLQKD